MGNLGRELVRKLVHLFQVPIIAAYTFLHFSFSPRIGVLALTALLLLLLEFEYFRVDYQTRLGSRITALFSRLFILRDPEKNNVTGAISFTMATIICFAAFDYQIALLALFLTVFGDLAAALMGTAFGERKIFRNKSYIGTFSGLVMNMFIGFVLFPEYPVVILPMALVASLVETLTQKLDDNLTVPLFSGFMGQLIIFWTKISLPQLF